MKVFLIAKAVAKVTMILLVMIFVGGLVLSLPHLYYHYVRDVDWEFSLLSLLASAAALSPILIVPRNFWKKVLGC